MVLFVDWHPRRTFPAKLWEGTIEFRRSIALHDGNGVGHTTLNLRQRRWRCTQGEVEKQARNRVRSIWRRKSLNAFDSSVTLQSKMPTLSCHLPQTQRSLYKHNRPSNPSIWPAFQQFSSESCQKTCSTNKLTKSITAWDKSAIRAKAILTSHDGASKDGTPDKYRLACQTR